MNTTLSPDEIIKFEQMAKDWWNPYGKFKPLHDLTPLRLEYIIETTKKHFGFNSLENLKVLDIGCGGGLVAEPIARLNANVTGIDASIINIDIAKNHANSSDLIINYQQILAEELVTTENKYQLILALEVIEHVENIELFIKTCCQLLEPGGIIIFSTINKSIPSFFKSIVAAEYILRWLPIGTHNWSKFVKPSTIANYTESFNLELFNLQGISYSLISNTWYLTEDISNNYFISFISN